MTKYEMLQLKLDGLTYQQIAEKAGISRQRVQQLISPPPTVRDFIVFKYGGKCKGCGIHVGKSGHVHHIEGLDLDSYNDLDNLVLLCLACHRKIHVTMPIDGSRLNVPQDSSDYLAGVKKIQVARGLTDAEMAELLDYSHRENWARIKAGRVPAGRSFGSRAITAFPELITTLAQGLKK